jgi:alpha-1,2-glucosyltransferase
MLVLLGLLLAKKRLYFKSAVAMFLSIWFRQTNVIWTVFIGLSISLDLMFSMLLRKPNYLQLLFEYPRFLLNNITIVVKAIGYHILVVFAFLYFVIQNGSIVLGDKSNHQASIHIPQVFYFFLFSFGFAFFALEPWRDVRGILNSVRQNRIASVLLMLMLYWSVKNYTYY